MTKDFAVQNNTFSCPQTLKKANLMSTNKPLISIFDKYDLDKNGELSSEEAKKASDEIYSYCDVTASTDCYDFSISKKKAKELKASGIELKTLDEFEYNLEKSFYVDGEAGSSFQGKSGDCWLLSGINALNNTPKGKEYIKQSIKAKDDGSYDVTFKGLDKTYNITKKDIDENFMNISRGDNDVKLLEIAVIKYNKELIQTGKGSSDLSQTKTYTGNSTLKSPLKGGGMDEQAILYLTGLDSKKYTLPEFMFKPGLEKGLYLKKEDVNKNLDDIMNNKSQYAVTTSFISNKKEMHPDHTYTIKRVEKDTVILINPTNSRAEISIPRKDYLDNMDTFVICDLGQ